MHMHIPTDQLPPDFQIRYQAVVDGSLRLDSVKKLKGFWLFAVKLGWEYPEKRPEIARAAFDAAHYDPHLKFVVYYANKSSAAL